MEIPVSTSIPEFQNWHLPVLRLMGRSNAVYKLFSRFLQYPRQALWLRPAKSNPYALFSVAEQIINHWPNGKTPILNIMTHNVEFITGASPKSFTEEDTEYLLRCLHALFVQLDKKYQVRKIGISEATNYKI